MKNKVKIIVTAILITLGLGESCVEAALLRLRPALNSLKKTSIETLQSSLQPKEFKPTSILLPKNTRTTAADVEKFRQIIETYPISFSENAETLFKSGCKDLTVPKPALNSIKLNQNPALLKLHAKNLNTNSETLQLIVRSLGIPKQAKPKKVSKPSSPAVSQKSLVPAQLPQPRTRDWLKSPNFIQSPRRSPFFPQETRLAQLLKNSLKPRPSVEALENSMVKPSQPKSNIVEFSKAEVIHQRNDFVFHTGKDSIYISSEEMKKALEAINNMLKNPNFDSTIVPAGAVKALLGNKEITLYIAPNYNGMKPGSIEPNLIIFDSSGTINESITLPRNFLTHDNSVPTVKYTQKNAINGAMQSEPTQIPELNYIDVPSETVSTKENSPSALLETTKTYVEKLKTAHKPYRRKFFNERLEGLPHADSAPRAISQLDDSSIKTVITPSVALEPVQDPLQTPAPSNNLPEKPGTPNAYHKTSRPKTNVKTFGRPAPIQKPNFSKLGTSSPWKKHESDSNSNVPKIILAALAPMTQLEDEGVTNSTDTAPIGEHRVSVFPEPTGQLKQYRRPDLPQTITAEQIPGPDVQQAPITEYNDNEEDADTRSKELFIPSIEENKDFGQVTVNPSRTQEFRNKAQRQEKEPEEPINITHPGDRLTMKVAPRNASDTATPIEGVIKRFGKEGKFETFTQPNNPHGNPSTETTPAATKSRPANNTDPKKDDNIAPQNKPEQNQVQDPLPQPDNIKNEEQALPKNTRTNEPANTASPSFSPSQFTPSAAKPTSSPSTGSTSSPAFKPAPHPTSSAPISGGNGSGSNYQAPAIIPQPLNNHGPATTIGPVTPVDLGKAAPPCTTRAELQLYPNASADSNQATHHRNKSHAAPIKEPASLTPLNSQAASSANAPATPAENKAPQRPNGTWGTVLKIGLYIMGMWNLAAGLIDKYLIKGLLRLVGLSPA